ncbi:hypothetical protein EON65_39550 [archaeon]|nr:MAG: hypothetical protein EON65_39550 [archaeon]
MPSRKKIDEVEAYCTSPNAEARQNILCDAIRQSLCVYPFGNGVYFFEVGPNLVKKIGGSENDALKSLLQQFAAVSMLALRATSDGDDNARVRTLRKNHPKAVAELDDFVPKNLPAYRMKLTLPEDFRTDCD